jgi:hypothetical protein
MVYSSSKQVVIRAPRDAIDATFSEIYTIAPYSQPWRADHELLASGAPSRLIRQAHRWAVALTLFTGLGIASVTGVLGGLAWQLAGGLNRTPDRAAIAEMLVACAVVGIITVAVSAATAPRQLQLAALRKE